MRSLTPFSALLNLFIEELITSTTYTYFFLILQDTVPNPYTTLTFTANQHHVRDMQLPLALNNSALLHLARGTRMPFDHVDAFDGQPPLLRKNSQDFALLPTIFTSDNFDEIVLFNMPWCLWNNFRACHTVSLAISASNAFRALLAPVR